MASRDNIRVTPAQQDDGHDYHYSGVAASPVGSDGKLESECSTVSAARQHLTSPAFLALLLTLGLVRTM